MRQMLTALERIRKPEAHQMESKLFEATWQQGADSISATVLAEDVTVAGKPLIRVEGKITEVMGPPPRTVTHRLFEELFPRLGDLPSADDEAVHEAAVSQMFREIDAAIPSGIPTLPEPIGPFILKPNSDDATIIAAIQRNIGVTNAVVQLLKPARL
jgi:hypothetical protein